MFNVMIKSVHELEPSLRRAYMKDTHVTFTTYSIIIMWPDLGKGYIGVSNYGQDLIESSIPFP